MQRDKEKGREGVCSLFDAAIMHAVFSGGFGGGDLLRGTASLREKTEKGEVREGGGIAHEGWEQVSPQMVLGGPEIRRPGFSYMVVSQ